jgi:acyl-CoA thioester hydrolase
VKHSSHRYACDVAFADTDASGRVHFSKILIYAERAEHDFLTQKGITVFAPEQLGWPRVKVSCDYLSPLYFQEKIEVNLTLEKIGTSSVSWLFEIIKENGSIAAKGGMVTVRVNAKGEPFPFVENEKQILEASA